MAHLFIFGLGYSATFLAKKLLAQGWQISGTRRQPAESLTEGMRIYPFDATEKQAWLLPQADYFLSSVPPDEESDPILRYFAEELRRLRPRWLGYLSTTGVYGDHHGAWVDETSPCFPSGPRQAYRFKAEREWLKLGAHIFRLAGIYGPGRSAFEQIAEGKARLIIKPGHCFGRIHVEDIANILSVSMQQPSAAEIYNLADDEPAEPIDVMNYAYQLLHKTPPVPIPYNQTLLSPMAQSFWQDHKKVSNAKVKRSLQYRFLFPTYREGLSAILPSFLSGNRVARERYES